MWVYCKHNFIIIFRLPELKKLNCKKIHPAEYTDYAIPNRNKYKRIPG